MNASVTPSDADNTNYAFSTSDDKVATVTPKMGKVTGVAPGKATITVTTEDGHKTATAVVTVTAEEEKPATNNTEAADSASKAENSSKKDDK